MLKLKAQNEFKKKKKILSKLLFYFEIDTKVQNNKFVILIKKKLYFIYSFEHLNKNIVSCMKIHIMS